MIICLHFVERKPGYPSCDLLILNKQLMQTGAARYVDVDQATRDVQQRRPQHQRQLGQMSRPHVTALQASADGEIGTGVVNRHGRAS